MSAAAPIDLSVIKPNIAEIETLISSHTQRARLLIATIALGILGMIPASLKTIQERKIPRIIPLQSLLNINKTIIVSGLALSLISISVALITVILQKNSLRKIALATKSLEEKTRPSPLTHDFIAKNLELIKEDLTEKEEQKIGSYLKAVIKQEHISKIATYEAMVTYQYVFLNPAFSIFSITAHNFFKIQRLFSDFEKINARLLEWRGLLYHLSRLTTEFPKGTFECLAALSTPEAWVEKKPFGIDPQNPEGKTSTPFVQYNISYTKFDPDDPPNVSVKYIEEGKITIRSFKTPWEFQNVYKFLEKEIL